MFLKVSALFTSQQALKLFAYLNIAHSFYLKNKLRNILRLDFLQNKCMVY
jgi:hypothetical protein